MPKWLYFLATFAESGLSLVGIRGTYDQPPYTVTRTLSPGIEIRRYAARTMVETTVTGDDQSAAFGRLFRYITGANIEQRRVSMTSPVEQSRLIAMTVPVETSQAANVMRFYLPPDVARDAPVPTDPAVRILTLPAATMGTIRYAGNATGSARSSQASLLRVALATAGLATADSAVYFSYDPPFAIPLFKRNEVAFLIRTEPRL